MKNWIVLLAAVLLFTACSKQEERSKKAGEDIAKKMKAPVNQTQAITDKIKMTRQADLPE